MYKCPPSWFDIVISFAMVVLLAPRHFGVNCLFALTT
jgi:hypothetical protein